MGLQSGRSGSLGRYSRTSRLSNSPLVHSGVPVTVTGVTCLYVYHSNNWHGLGADDDIYAGIPRPDYSVHVYDEPLLAKFKENKHYLTDQA